MIGDDFNEWRPRSKDAPEQLTALGKALLSAVTVTGPGTAVDLTAQARNATMQVVLGGTVDPQCQVALQGSVDGINFFGLGVVTGNGYCSNTGHVVQYVRANVLKIASGNVTATASYA